MRLPPLIAASLFVFGIAGLAPTVGAEGKADADHQREYFSIDVAPLVADWGPDDVVSPKPLPRNAWYQRDGSPRVVVSAGGEAYLSVPENRDDDFVGYKIVGSKPVGEPLAGQLFLLRKSVGDSKQSVLVRLPFEVAAKVEDEVQRRDFLLAKGEHFQRLWSEEMAGAAMFRHLATEAMSDLGRTATSTGPNWPLRRNDGIDDTIQLMSGGRAVSENLQLDRQLAATSKSDQWKSLDKVRGITVREINWTTRLKQGDATELDPLAGNIPHDQHAMFLPSFAALVKIIDQGNRLARPAVQWMEPQSRRTDVLGFYQQQIGLPLNALTRQLGGVLIGEIALTGSDPYFRTGTDVAIVLQSKQPQFLRQALMTQIAAEAGKRNDVTQTTTQFTGHPVTRWASPDRHFCSLVVATDDAVIVSNSMTQLGRILQCADGKSPSLAGLDEYRFFRQRYRRDAANESALLMISDATIRRWCSPQWRIAASRRTRARGTIAEVTMRHADALVLDTVGESRQVSLPDNAPDAGELWLRPSGVHSKKYGSLQFQTPIVEMDMQRATTKEIALYETWRRQYERQWRNAFDPIALQLSLGDESLKADLSVIPLMIRTQYRWWVDWVGDTRLKLDAGDPHGDALYTVDVAIDLQSSTLNMARGFLRQQNGGLGANVDILGWIDGSASFYMDPDPDWQQRLKRNFETGWDQDLARDAPVALFIPSRDNFRMTAFIVAARGLIQQFAPNMIRFEQKEHHGVSYVVATIEMNRADRREQPQGYYVTTPDGLTLSLNENVVRRAIDRYSKRSKLEKSDDGEAAETADSTGDGSVEKDSGADDFRPQMAASINGDGFRMMSLTNYSSGMRRMSRLAWSNVPILNYLRGRYPDQDPRNVYRKLLGQTLVDPADGEYVWSEKFATYQSSLYGHRLAPRLGPPMSKALSENEQAEMTLSFDDGGLRTTLELTRAPDAASVEKEVDAPEDAAP